MTAEQSSVEDLVERVRAGIYDGGNGHRFHDALAALDSLTAALERAERERDAGNEKHLVLWQRWQDAEARAQKAEAERADTEQLLDEAIDREKVLEAQLEKAEAVVPGAGHPTC
jgi:chromosome segregation ATPase